ncbi:MAG: hypothetical protein KatS3mg050_5023 [Litorilinea sp.]|nr:MAG: hypothetical protein KatS3mg050_5023 [Litorilinea sp.]
MSRKRKRTKRRAQKKAPLATRSTNLLNALVRQVEQGDTLGVLESRETVLRQIPQGPHRQQAQRLIAEAYFREAASRFDLSRRLSLLDEALTLVPDWPKLRFHRGVTLWRLGRLREALAEWEQVAAQEPDRPGLRFLLVLAHLALGETPASGNLADNLNPDEKARLAVVSALRRNGQEPLPAYLLDDLPADEAAFWMAFASMRVEPNAVPAETLAPVARKGPGAFSYLWGLAALRQGDSQTAFTAWQQAREAGFTAPGFDQNYIYLVRERVVELATQEDWQAVAQFYESVIPLPGEDRILAETVAAAYFYLGYGAAEQQKWPEAARYWRRAWALKASRALAQNLALAGMRQERWQEAAEAWREMIRRRPRRSDDPDSLTDAQVAMAWQMAATCYLQDDNLDEAITCLKNALKYDQSPELSLQLVDLYMGEERVEAAEGELGRLLEVHPDHVPALMRLAELYRRRWNRNPAPLWRRVLAIEPQNEEARNALAEWYLEQVGEIAEPSSIFSRIFRSTNTQKIKLLEQGLAEVPDHPILLVMLGKLYGQAKKKAEAREHLERAWDLAGNQIEIVGVALHELLHVKGGEIVEARLPRLRQFPGLRAQFWIDQGNQVLECDLDRKWATIFWDEALAHLERVQDANTSRAEVLSQIFESTVIYNAHDLAEQYLQRIRTEVPQSGAVEFAEACLASLRDKKPWEQVRPLLTRARSKARRAHDKPMEELIEQRLFPLTDLRLLGMLE